MCRKIHWKFPVVFICNKTWDTGSKHLADHLPPPLQEKQKNPKTLSTNPIGLSFLVHKRYLELHSKDSPAKFSYKLKTFQISWGSWRLFKKSPPASLVFRRMLHCCEAAERCRWVDNDGILGELLAKMHGKKKNLLCTFCFWPALSTVIDIQKSFMNN